MTGPEHFKEAELFLAKAAKIAAHLASLGDSVPDSALPEIAAGERAMLTVTARAQVHATLALTAASIGCDFDQWLDVLAKPEAVSDAG